MGQYVTTKKGTYYVPSAKDYSSGKVSKSTGTTKVSDVTSNTTIYSNTAPTTTTSTPKILNGSAGALRAFENSGQTINEFVNDSNNAAYVKDDTEGISTGTPSLTATLLATPSLTQTSAPTPSVKQSALGTALSFATGAKLLGGESVGATSMQDDLAKSRLGNKLGTVQALWAANKASKNLTKANNNDSMKYFNILEQTQNATNEESKTGLGKMLDSIANSGKRINPFLKDDTVNVVNPTPSQSTQPTTPANTQPTTPSTTEEPTSPTTPVEISAENKTDPEVLKVYDFMDKNGIGGYIFSDTLIDDPDAYEVVVEELTKLFGADMATKVLSDWATKYYETYGVSAAKVRKGLVDVDYTGNKGSGSGSSSGDTYTTEDAALALQEKLASINQSYDRNDRVYSLNQENEDIQKQKAQNEINKRVAAKNFAEAANATGLASGVMSQEDQARDIAYKNAFKALNEQEASNNKLLQKYKDQKQEDINAAYSAYENAVEAIKEYNAQQRLEKAKKEAEAQAAAEQAEADKKAARISIINSEIDGKTANEAVGIVADCVGEGYITEAEGEKILDNAGVTQTIAAKKAYEELPGSAKLATRFLKLMYDVNPFASRG